MPQKNKMFAGLLGLITLYLISRKNVVKAQQQTQQQTQGQEQQIQQPEQQPNTIFSAVVEEDLIDYYFKPLFSLKRGVYFQFRGSYSSNPYLVTVKQYGDRENVLGIKANIPSVSYDRQNPNDWLPAVIVS